MSIAVPFKRTTSFSNGGTGNRRRRSSAFSGEHTPIIPENDESTNREEFNFSDAFKEMLSKDIEREKRVKYITDRIKLKKVRKAYTGRKAQSQKAFFRSSRQTLAPSDSMPSFLTLTVPTERRKKRSRTRKEEK
jgi:hypothetical protein